MTRWLLVCAVFFFGGGFKTRRLWKFFKHNLKTNLLWKLCWTLSNTIFLKSPSLNVEQYWKSYGNHLVCLVIQNTNFIETSLHKIFFCAPKNRQNNKFEIQFCWAHIIIIINKMFTNFNSFDCRKELSVDNSWVSLGFWFV